MRLLRPVRPFTSVPRALAMLTVVGVAGGFSSVMTLHSPAKLQPGPRGPAHAAHSARSTAPWTAPATAPAATTTSVAPPGMAEPQSPAPAPGGLPPPGPGFTPGQVTTVGDSVMVDAAGPIQADIPGAQVDAAVSRQWSDGEQVVRARKASGQLGAVVVVNLGTNGPITAGDFDAMMSVLQGASRVVFMTVHVDQPWQDQVNSVLESGVTRYPDTILADWESLASQHPEWFGSDGTHMPIGGSGAQAYASLLAGKV